METVTVVLQVKADSKETVEDWVANVVCMNGDYVTVEGWDVQE